MHGAYSFSLPLSLALLSPLGPWPLRLSSGAQQMTASTLPPLSVWPCGTPGREQRGSAKGNGFEIPNCPSQESICACLERVTPCSCRSQSLERLRVSDTGGSRGPAATAVIYSDAAKSTPFPKGSPKSLFGDACWGSRPSKDDDKWIQANEKASK